MRLQPKTRLEHVKYLPQSDFSIPERAQGDSNLGTFDHFLACRQIALHSH